MKHGMYGTPTYNSWRNMRERVKGRGHSTYEGVDMEPRWADFAEFYKDMGQRPEGMTIDRIDNSGGYHPDNCRWADLKTQARNRDYCCNLTYKGVTKNKAQWAEDLGMNYSTLNSRMIRGWDIARMLEQPVGRYTK